MSQNIDFTTLPASQQAWQALTFTNGWSNFGLGYAVCAYMKDSFGFVHLNGLVAGGAMGASIFILPVGYRPALTLDIAAVSNTTFGMMTIGNDGTVIPMVGNNTWVSLCGITFRAEL